MPVRIKITLIFTFIMSLLLLLFCSFIYYFFYTSRLENIKAHLTNHAVTTARMLDEPEVFDQNLIKNALKTVQNHPILVILWVIAARI